MGNVLIKGLHRKGNIKNVRLKFEDTYRDGYNHVSIVVD